MELAKELLKQGVFVLLSGVLLWFLMGAILREIRAGMRKSHLATEKQTSVSQAILATNVAEREQSLIRDAAIFGLKLDSELAPSEVKEMAAEYFRQTQEIQKKLAEKLEQQDRKQEAYLEILLLSEGQERKTKIEKLLDLLRETK